MFYQLFSSDKPSVRRTMSKVSRRRSQGGARTTDFFRFLCGGAEISVPDATKYVAPTPPFTSGEPVGRKEVGRMI